MPSVKDEGKEEEEEDYPTYVQKKVDEVVVEGVMLLRIIGGVAVITVIVIKVVVMEVTVFDEAVLEGVVGDTVVLERLVDDVVVL